MNFEPVIETPFGPDQGGNSDHVHLADELQPVMMIVRRAGA